MIRKLLKNLSEYVTLLIKSYYFLIQISFKYNIKLVYFVTNNKFLYLIHIFSIRFTFYSRTDPSYFHLVSAIFFAYPLTTIITLSV